MTSVRGDDVSTSVDLVVNCFGRGYRRVAQPGFVADLATAQCHPFDEVTVAAGCRADDPRRTR